MGLRFMLWSLASALAATVASSASCSPLVCGVGSWSDGGVRVRM
jgi:hypothetical protein